MPRDRIPDLKQNYWDYLCAVSNLTKVLNAPDYQKIDGRPSYIERATRELSFLDHCHFFYSKTPVSPIDKRCLHFKILAPRKWYAAMDRAGFKVSTLGDAYGTSEQFVQTGIAVSDDKPLKDEFILIDSHIALQYDGRGQQNSTFSAELRPFWTFLNRFIAVCAAHKIDMGQDTESIKNISYPLYAKHLYAEDVELAAKYLNLTLCPLINNLQRYEQDRGVSFWGQPTPQNLGEQEKVLWSIAKLRDAYLAHNQHFPFAVSAPDKKYDISAVMLNNSVDYNKIFEVLKNSVPKILGFKDPQEAIDTLQSDFPNLTNHTVFLFPEEEIPLYHFLASYINSTLVFNDSFEQLFTKKSKRRDFDFILERCGISEPDRQWLLLDEGVTRHRNIALHEHMPVMEIMGIKDRKQTSYASWPMPKNVLEQIDTIHRITRHLITAYHNNDHTQIMNDVQIRQARREQGR